MRAIGFLLLVILVFLIVRFTLNRIIAIRQQQNRARQAESDKQKAEHTSANGEMVRCAQCGVHLPQSEAYYDGKDTFCSEGHMRAYHKEHQS